MTTTPRRVVTATLATLALAGAVAPGAGAAANPPAAPAAPTFNTVKLPDAGGGTEPRITVAPDGKRYVITNAGDAVVYTSTDGGQTWKQVTKPGGQTSPTIDVDIIAAHNGRLLASELDLAGINFPTSYSDDGGQTWTAALGSTNLVDQDRQWFAFGPDDPSTGKPRAYLLYHNLGSGAIQHNMWVATSTDGGETFGPPVPVALPGTDAYADLQCADSGGPSSMAVNPKTGRVYVTYTTRAAVPVDGGPDFGGCGASVFGPLEINIVNATRVWVARSDSGLPGTWTNSLAVDDSKTGQVVSMQLAYGVLDNQGNVYVAYPESPNPYPDLRGAAVKLRYADPDMKQWSAPVTLVPTGGAGSTLVHLAVGDPGKIDVAYFKGEDQPKAEPAWYLHVVQSLDARSASPHVQDVKVSPIPAYSWTASHMMGICGTPGPAQGVENGFACSRSTDVWGITLDSTCHLALAWPTVSADAPGNDPGTYVSTQTGGPTVCGPQGPGAPSANAACLDKKAPASRFATKSVRASRKSISLGGATRDRGCLKGKASAVVKGNVKRVSVAVARKAGSRCRYLRSSGRFGPAGSCSKAAYLIAHGKTRWSLKLHGSFPAGRYVARVRAVDKRGNVEKPRGAAVLTFRVR